MDVFSNKIKDKSYHLGHFFMDLLKQKPPEGIFQIDAATGETETNASVLSRSIQLARCFTKFGLRPGDVVALGGRNHCDLHIPYYAALLNGLPIVGVDPYFKYHEIRHLFKLTEPKIAFCQSDTLDIYEKAAEDLGIDVKMVTFDGDGCTLAKFMETYRDDDTEEFQPADIDTDKIYAWLVSTSGTTGLPKVAAFKHKPLLTQLFGCVAMTRYPATDSSKLGLYMSPVQWISAFFQAIAFPAMNLCKLQTSLADNIEHIIDVINKYKPVNTVTSPSMMSSILNHEKECDVTCFDIFTVSGAKSYNVHIQEMKKRLRENAVLMEVYGQTETIGPMLWPNPKGPPGCCGVPMPTTLRELKLVDPETGDEITKPDIPGELWVTGPTFSEYYNNPEETAKAFTVDKSGKKWYKSGDILYRDESNNFFFVDRMKMLIKYKNYHVNPNLLEEVIMRLDGVQEACVLGIPNEQDGQHPVACVVPRLGYDVTAEQVKDIVSNRLSNSNQLRGGVVFLDSIPKTSSGKIALAQLKTIVLNAKRE